MNTFNPEFIVFEPSALEYPLGKELYKRFDSEGRQIYIKNIQGIMSVIPGQSKSEKYRNAKKTLAVSVKRFNQLYSCLPSADYEFSLVSNCPGCCEYCYLQTTYGDKSYMKVFVNIGDILEMVKTYSGKKEGTTVFEASSQGDPLSVEYLTGSLSQAIIYFGKLNNAKLKFVTKFPDYHPIVDLPHNGNTKIRFSVNSEENIRKYEHNTSSLDERLNGAEVLSESGYPVGFVIAPVIISSDWKKNYDSMLSKIADVFKKKTVTFEIILHRFTVKSRDLILERFPNTGLDLEIEDKRLKWGKFGRSKYIYSQEDYLIVEKFFIDNINTYFEKSVIEYLT